MTNTLPPADTDSARLLARSAFLIVFLALLATIISALVIFNAPIRPAPRAALAVGYGVVALLLALVGWRLLRTEPEALITPSGRLVTALSRGKTGFGLAVVLLELNFLVFAFVNGIAPTLLALAFLLLVWSGLAWTVIYIANRQPLLGWLARTRPVWANLGLWLGVIAGLALLFLVTSFVLNATGVIERLRGAADYRTLTFFGGEADAQRSSDYWAELGGLQAQWLPYTYSRIQPNDGTYINVSADGLRRTTNVIENSPDMPQVYFFGGSTMWGDGARDGYTIASHTARRLHEGGHDAYVTNYGQVAYVSTQDLILFQRQLALGRSPDVAVFYEGFNDLASVYIHDGELGLPHNEINRAEEFYTGRLMDSGQIILRRPRLSLDQFDFSLVSATDATPESFVEFYLTNLRLLQAAADAFDVKVIIVWQPALLYKTTRTAEEEQALQANETLWPGFNTFYEAVDTLLRQRAGDDGLDNLLFLSDLFRDEVGYRFIDRVHITEDGNNTVAQAIVPSIAAALDED